MFNRSGGPFSARLEMKCDGQYKMQCTLSKRTLILLFSAVFIALGPHAANAQEAASSHLVKVKSEGFAPGSSLNSRSRAISIAERKAVELFLTHYIGLPDLRIARRVVEAASLYTDSSRLLEFSHTDGGTRVMVEVYLRAERVRADLAALIFQQLADPPAVLLLIAEDDSFSSRALGNAETILSKAFSETGFRLIDPLAARRDFTRSQLLSILRGSDNDAAQLGLAMDADIVVLGNAKLETQSGGGAGNVSRFTATLRLRAIRALDGVVLDDKTTKATVQSHMPRDGAAMATRDAAAKQQDAMMVASVLGVYGQRPSSSDVMLTIENVQGSGLIQSVEVGIAKIDGVSRVELIRLFQGTAVLRITYQGKMAGLADGIDTIAGRDFHIDLTQGVGRELSCRVVSRIGGS